MKKLLLAVSLFALIAPDIALAQQQPEPPRGGGQARPPRPGGDGQPGRPGGPQIQPPRPGNGGPQIQPPRPGRPDRPQPPRPGGPQIQPPRPGNGFRPDRPHRPGAGRPPGFRPIHGPSFRYPRGYGYRRWSIGLLLPGLFLSDRYYYNNYDALGVGPPPPGYRWVRYGPDLLLVQRGSGRIADVIYGAFY